MNQIMGRYYFTLFSKSFSVCLSHILKFGCLFSAQSITIEIQFMIKPSRKQFTNSTKILSTFCHNNHSQAILSYFYLVLDEIKEAKKFREFWGERSELRRFQDGIVREAVVWSKNKSEIIGEILRTVITRRWSGVTLTEYESYNRNILNGDGGATCRQYLDQITPVLYGLEDIALSITAVIALGEELRLSRVGTQSSGWDIKKGDYRGEDMCKKLQDEFSVPPYVTVMDVLLSPLRSGKWPEDQEAVRRLKIAWLSEVGNALENKLRDIKQFIFEENLLIVDTKKKVALR